MYIRHLVHAKRSLIFGPLQNVREHVWSMPDSFERDQISRTFWRGPNVSMDVLGRSKYDQISMNFWHGPNILWIFWTGLNVLQGSGVAPGPHFLF